MKAKIEYTDSNKNRTEEINTLQDLIDLYHREHEELILTEYEGILYIEVYNDYRE